MGSAKPTTDRPLAPLSTAIDQHDAAVRREALRARIRELDVSDLEDGLPATAESTVETQCSAETEIHTPVSSDRVAIDQRPISAARALRHRLATNSVPIAPTADRRDDPPARHLLKLTPPWLVSAVLHASLLVILALWVTRPILSSLPMQLVIAPAEPATTVEPPAEIKIANMVPDDPEPLAVDPSPSVELSLDVPAPISLADFDITSSGRAEQLRATQTVGGTGQRSPIQAKGVQFYGIQAPGSRFVFVVDSSASMRIKFHEAKRELEQAVCGLDEGQLFYVIFFDQKTKRLRLGKWTQRGRRFALRRQPEKDLVPANDENIESLIHWMNTIELGPDTNPYPAVTYALRKLEPDAIFLLSDGEFRDGGRTEAFLKKENRLPTLPGPKTVVHCVGFYSRVGEITLERIAKDNGGTYRFINSPPAAMIRPAFGAKFPRR